MCGFRRFTGFLQLQFSPKNQQKINRAEKINGFTNSPPAAVKCENIYVPIRPGAVPLVSKTNSVILLSLFCCLSILYRLVFIFSMAQRNSAAQCQTGRNSTNPGKSEKFAWKCVIKSPVFSVLVIPHYSGRRCPRWCYLLGLAVAGVWCVAGGVRLAVSWWRACKRTATPRPGGVPSRISWKNRSKILFR